MDVAVPGVRVEPVEQGSAARKVRKDALEPDSDAVLEQMVRSRTAMLESANGELQRLLAERTSQLQALGQELQAFTYSVSHDLRAPLRSMDGFSRVLIEDYAQQLDDQARDYLQRVRGASQRMAQLIEDILQLSRLSRAEMNVGRINVGEIATQILDGLQQREPKRQLQRVVPDDVEAYGDPVLVRVLLEHLIGNAWKFSSKHPSAKIEVGRRDGEEGPVYFVRDDGAGFDMAYSNKLFGMFQRLHSGSEFEGTGMGLAAVQCIVRRHGGRVWAEAKVEQGATFCFTLATPQAAVDHHDGPAATDQAAVSVS